MTYSTRVTFLTPTNQRDDTLISGLNDFVALRLCQSRNGISRLEIRRRQRKSYLEHTVLTCHLLKDGGTSIKLFIINIKTNAGL